MSAYRPVFKIDQLYEGMEVEVITLRGKVARAKIIRLHAVKVAKFLLDQFPENSVPGGCDFAYHDGEVHSSLRKYSVDGTPLESSCQAGNCIHVRYRNNRQDVVGLWSVRPVNPLKLLAEQGK